MDNENNDVSVEMGITLKKLTRQLAQAEARMNKSAKKTEDYYQKLAESGVDSVARVDRRTRQLQGTMGGLQKQAGGFAAKMGPALAAAFSIGAITTFSRAAKQAISDVARIGDQAALAGLDTTSFQELDFVASQTRIGMDILADGIKEVQLRADEFAVTGKGSAAEAFARLGFSGEEVARQLEKPSEMFLEIIGRLEDLDTAAQIRISDELFGGSAGERFVQLLGEGESGLRDMISRGREIGAVIDADIITKAQELDAKFAEVGTRLRTMWQEGIVGAATFFGIVGDDESLTRLVEITDRLREAYPDIQIPTIAGDSNIADVAEDLEYLEDNMTATVGYAGDLRDVVEGLAQSLFDAGFADQAHDLGDMASEILDVTRQANDGELAFEDYRAKLAEFAEEADGAAISLSSIDEATFENVSARIGTLIGQLAFLRQTARGALGAIAQQSSYVEDGHFFDDAANDALVNPATANAPTTSPRPRPPPNDIDFGLPPTPSNVSGSRGRSGGGGASRRDELKDLLADGEAELRQMQQRIDLIGKTDAEQAKLEFTYRALEDAKRANLDLDKMVNSTGLTLRENIAAQAEEVYRLSEAYERGQIEQRSFEDGLKSMSDNLASAIVQGKNLGDVLSNAFLRAGEAFLASGINDGFSLLAGGIGGGGGTGSAILKGLFGAVVPSFEGGGYTGHGTRQGGIDGRGGFPVIVHPNETIIDHTRLNAPMIGGASRIQVEVYVRDDGRLAAIARQEGAMGGQAVAVQVRNDVPAIMEDYQRRNG